jgi:hypothetical protein
MTYSSGGLIQASDYNSFVSSVNTLWGTGSTDSGYGQSSTLSTVSASGVVTASNWASLITLMGTINSHEGGGSLGLSAPTSGNVVTYLSTLSSAITTLQTNRLSFVSQGTTTSTNATNATTWSTSSVKIIKVQFGSNANMRYFFNAGGQITLDCLSSALSGNTKSTTWQSLVTACGTVRIRATATAKVGGSGTPSVLNTGLGFYNLTSSSQTILKQFSPTAPYTPNYAQFDAWLDAAPSSATALNFAVTLADVETPDTFGSQQVSGTTRADCIVTYPETTYLTNTWGTATFTTTTNTQA